MYFVYFEFKIYFNRNGISDQPEFDQPETEERDTFTVQAITNTTPTSTPTSLNYNSKLEFPCNTL